MADLGIKSLKHLPRLAIIDLMLGQALSAATVLWSEVAADGRCALEAENLVDDIVAALAELDTLQNCLRKRK